MTTQKNPETGKKSAFGRKLVLLHVKANGPLMCKWLEGTSRGPQN